MAHYGVWYLRSRYAQNPNFYCGVGCKPILPLLEANLLEGEGLEKTHVFIRTIDADDEEAAWSNLNHWVANEEQRAVIAAEDSCHHTSMSVGDLLVDEAGNVHVADSFGFVTIDATF